jgi:hypothetical protein
MTSVFHLLPSSLTRLHSVLPFCGHAQAMLYTRAVTLLHSHSLLAIVSVWLFVHLRDCVYATHEEIELKLL